MSHPLQNSLRSKRKFAGIIFISVSRKLEQMLNLERKTTLKILLPFKTTKNNPIKCSKFPLADVILILWLFR